MPFEADNTETPETTGTSQSDATPETGAPVVQDNNTQEDAPDIDWKQRYEDLRPEADRRASLLADFEGRNGPERQAQALATYAQIELEQEEAAAVADEDDESFDYTDPSDEVAQLREEIAQEREQQQEAEFQQLEADYIESTVEGLEQQHNTQLSDREYELVVNYALANRDSHDGKPDLDGGFVALKEAQDAARQRYLESKNSAALAPTGTAGDRKVNLRSKEDRVKLATEAFEAAEAQKSNL